LCAFANSGKLLDLKFLDWNDDALPRDHIDDGEHARLKSGVRKIHDRSFYRFNGRQRFGQLVAAGQKYVLNMKVDDIPLLYQGSPLVGD
jgi:hypothetical protein